MQTLHMCVETNYLNSSYVGFSQCAKKTIVKLVQWFLTAGFKKFPGERKLLHALHYRKFLNENVSLPNVMPLLILRRYMLFCLLPAEMEVRVKFLEILQAEYEPAYKHSKHKIW